MRSPHQHFFFLTQLLEEITDEGGSEGVWMASHRRACNGDREGGNGEQHVSNLQVRLAGGRQVGCQLKLLDFGFAHSDNALRTDTVSTMPEDGRRDVAAQSS